jgi:resuscitation-promoting factor RpfC
MSLPSIAAGGVAKALIAVTVSLHPAPAHHGSHYVTVRPGDTLSSISRREYGRAADWPALWWINRHRTPDPAMIRAGQRLRLSDWHPLRLWLTRAALTAIPAPPVAVPAAQPASSAQFAGAAPASAQPAGTNSAAPGSFQDCVIHAESGGNAQAVNPSSGAGGLYGFLPSTWQALGYSGRPEDASASEQNAAFAKEYAQSGSAAWSAYDGC